MLAVVSPDDLVKLLKRHPNWARAEAANALLQREVGSLEGITRAVQAATEPTDAQRVLQNGYQGAIANGGSRERVSTTVGADGTATQERLAERSVELPEGAGIQIQSQQVHQTAAVPDELTNKMMSSIITMSTGINTLTGVVRDKFSELDATNAEQDKKNAEQDATAEANKAELVTKNAELEAKNTELEAKDAELEAKTDGLKADIDANDAERISKNAELEVKTDGLKADIEKRFDALEEKCARIDTSTVDAAMVMCEAKNELLVARNAELESKTDALKAEIAVTNANFEKLQGKNKKKRAHSDKCMKQHNGETRTRQSHPHMDWKPYLNFKNGRWGYKRHKGKIIGGLVPKYMESTGFKTSTEAYTAMETANTAYETGVEKAKNESVAMDVESTPSASRMVDVSVEAN